METLIAITEQNNQQVVSARELYSFLEVKSDFSTWCKRMFEYGFEENKDYSLAKIGERNAHNKIDYALTIDTAKEISMLQRSDKGKQARQYFIEVEKRVKTKVLDFSNPDTVLQLAQNWKAEKEKREFLEQQNQYQAKELQKAVPKVNYFDEVLQSNSTYTTNQIAKELGMSAIGLNKRLNDLHIQYKQSDTWLLYAKYQDKGYTKTKTHTFTDSLGKQQTAMNTVWTEKGRLFVHQLVDIGSHKYNLYQNLEKLDNAV